MLGYMLLEGFYVEEKKVIKDFKKIILMVVGVVVKMQMDGKVNFKEEQEVLMNVLNFMLDVYLVELLLLRVEKLVGMDIEIDQEFYDFIFKVFVMDVNVRIQKQVIDVLVFFFEGDMFRILLMGFKCFGKYMLTNVKQEC